MMAYRLSECLCLQTPDLDKALEFYMDVMGLEVKQREGETVELETGRSRLFLDKGQPLGPILEFLVPDAEAAREELLKAGCQVVRWDGKGGCCYMRDPFGFVFNLYEEPETL
ncbi:MAG: VOC family protein [Thermoplasmata archaeon]